MLLCVRRCAGTLSSNAASTPRSSGLTAPAIEVHGLRKAFGSVQAVDDVSFSVRPGEILGFLGPNGAGKTTTIRAVIGIVAPDAGDIRIHGQPPNLELRRRIGYLPEERGLHRGVRTSDAVEYLGRLRGLSRAQARFRTEAWLGRLDLAEGAARKTDELSRGMAQKAQIAATLLGDPDILILDEPTQNLDPINVKLLLDIIRERRDAGAAIVISTHVMSQVEHLADRIYLIADGRGVVEGRVADVRRAYAPSAVRFASPDRVADLPGVAELRDDEGAYYAVLAEGVEPDAVLHELVRRGVRLDRFERALASLDDVFIQAVREAGRHA